MSYHFLGLETFKGAYPGVRIIATSTVVDRINKVYQEKIDKWKKILRSGATSHAVAIEKFDGNVIKLEGAKIEVLKSIQGDTDEKHDALDSRPENSHCWRCLVQAILRNNAVCKEVNPGRRCITGIGSHLKPAPKAVQCYRDDNLPARVGNQVHA